MHVSILKPFPAVLIFLAFTLLLFPSQTLWLQFPFCSSCYLQNFICSTAEALCDPVLQLRVRFDFDMNLYACVKGACVCVCMHVCIRDLQQVFIITDQSFAALLHGLFTTPTFLCCSTINSVDPYCDIFFNHLGVLRITLLQFSLLFTVRPLCLTHNIPCDWFYLSLT